MGAPKAKPKKKLPEATERPGPKIRCLYDKLIPVSDLKPYPKNRNQHPPDQIERLAKIIAYQGVRAPIVCTRDNVIAKGHGTLEAFKMAGGNVIPVVYQDFESDEQLYAFVQSDNAIASWSDLDFSGINADIGDLGPEFTDLDLLGIKDFTLDVSEKHENEKEETGMDEERCPTCGNKQKKG